MRIHGALGGIHDPALTAGPQRLNDQPLAIGCITERRFAVPCYSREMFRRVIWIVLDSVGIGEMPDAADYGDAGSDTLGNLARLRPMRLPNMCRLGLGNIKPLAGLPPDPAPVAAVRRRTPASPGEDTTTGHWEMAGIH